MMKTKFLIGFTAMIALIVGNSCQQGCNNPGLVNIARALRDTDNDGWYDTTTNQRVDLFITEVLIVGGGGLIGPGSLNIIVDDQILSGGNSSGNVGPTTSVATRFIGTWLLEGGDHPKTFLSKVKIFGGSIGGSNDLQPLEVKWQNKDSTWTINTSMGAITFRTAVTRFADPNPNNASADDDGDGITEKEETLLAGLNVNGGDLNSRDIVLAVTHTHKDFALRPFAKEQLVAVFKSHGFNLHIIDNANTLRGIKGGQIRNTTADSLFSIVQGPSHSTIATIRPSLIDTSFEAFTHLAIFQREMLIIDTPATNGRSSGIPGLDLVFKASLPILGRDLWDYQAKLLMHEFGHNLGLCHPLGGGPCAALPAAEQNNGTTVMGTPAHDPNIIFNIANTLNRPLDYSPTQWRSINLRTVRNSTR